MVRAIRYSGILCLALATLFIWSVLPVRGTGSLPRRHADGIEEPPAAYEHPQRLVSLPDGRRINMFCTGNGTPVVIMEAGGGEDSLTFRRLQPRVASVTRVCSYDRAGLGFSDPAGAPNTAAHIVADMHAMIASAGIVGSVVLVGHSNGGLYARLYASIYPDEVAGMVMIDPNSVGLNRDAEAALDDGQRNAWRASDREDYAQARRCLELARSGSLARKPASHPQCTDEPATPGLGLHRVLDEQLSRPSYEEALYSEVLDTHPQEGGGLSMAEVAVGGKAFDFADKPFIVVSGTNEQGGLPARQRAEVIKAMLANQRDLASHSSHGRQVLVNVSSEDIQLTHPGLVAKEIASVINQIRGPTHPEPHVGAGRARDASRAAKSTP